MTTTTNMTTTTWRQPPTKNMTRRQRPTKNMTRRQQRNNNAWTRLTNEHNTHGHYTQLPTKETKHTPHNKVSNETSLVIPCWCVHQKAHDRNSDKTTETRGRTTRLMTTRHKTTDNRDHTEDTDHRTQHANDADHKPKHTTHTTQTQNTHHPYTNTTHAIQGTTKWRVWAVVPCAVMWCDVVWCGVMWCDVMWCHVMCRADVLWVLYAVCGCVLCMVCAECVLYCAIFYKQEKIQKMKKYRIFTWLKNGTPGINPVSDFFLPDWKMTPSGKESGR